MQTVVGLYRSVAEATKVKEALVNEGYSGGDVTVIDQSESGYNDGSYSDGSNTATGSGVSGLTGSNAGITNTRTADFGGGNTTTEDTVDTGVGAKIKHFFQDLTGHDEHTHSAYTQGLNNGGALVAVRVNENEAERAAAVLRSYGASDIEGDDAPRGGRTEESFGTRTGGFDTTNTDTARGTTTGEQVIPVVAEELVVGKREVQRGGVRVYSHVVSEPVSESVQLHDEKVLVDRRTVNRPATEADFSNAGPIEVRAMGEEAVVGKTGRVVEEVVVGKTATDRTETIEDSVRHTEVDVQPVGTDINDTTTRSNTGSKF